MKIIYLGLNDRAHTIQKINEGELPSNCLYGLIELRKMGFEVSQTSSRPSGRFEKAFKKINEKFGTNIPSFKVIKKIYSNDFVVVNGPISTVITLLCRILNKKIIYLDSVLRSPSNALRKFVYKLNLRLANGTIMYSENQSRHCSRVFGVPESCFKLIPFSIDMTFFLPHASARGPEGEASEKYILSVGRDQARDYQTLVRAVDGLGVKLKIVTIPYLLEGVDIDLPHIEVFENLPYAELFRLYRFASLVVIPLKKWGTLYSSGTTSLLEAIALGKSVVATRSEPMMEYATSQSGLAYVEAEDVDSLREAIKNYLDQEDTQIPQSERERICRRYDMKHFAEEFGAYLKEMVSQ